MVLDSPIISGSSTFLSNVTITGSLLVSGSITMSGSIASASYATTASYANNATTASYAVNATTASYAANTTTSSYTLNATTASYAVNATTASYAVNSTTASYAATASSADNLTVRNTITAQTLVVQTITSSVEYSSGSNVFGNSLANNQTFTGSVLMYGSGSYFNGFLNIGANTTYAGQIGFNRDVNNGTIFTASFGAYQIQNYQGVLQIQAYSSSGAQLTSNAFAISGSSIGIGTPSPQGLLHLSATSPTLTLADSSASGNGGNVYINVNKPGVGYNNLTMTAYSYNFLGGGSATNFFSINSAGGATFYSGATFGSDVFTYANGGIFFNGGGSYTSGIFQNSNGLNLQTGGSPRLTISSAGLATFTSADNSGARTTLNDVLTIYQTNNSVPYSGFGSAILFKGTTYNSGGSGVAGTRNWGRIGMYLTDSSFNTTGENMYFAVASADNSDTLTTAMTIQYDGKIGIGTAGPTGLLEVYKSNSGGLGGYIVLNNNGSAVSNETAIMFQDGSSSGVRAAISSTTEDSPYYGDIKFKTGISAYGSLNTRMKITGAGNVYIGPATGVSGGPGTSRLNIVGAASVGENTNGTCVMDAFNSYAYYGCNGSTYAIWIGPSGLVYNYSNSTTFNTTSDIRVKENVVTLPNALDKITALNPVTFDYKQDFADHRSWNDTQKNDNIGFIAQEFAEVFPKYVHSIEETINGETVEDFKTIDTGHLVPYLVKAIQELKLENDSLKSRIEALENK